MLKGKSILLGVTGSIAAYKAATLASMLVKLHADVHVMMTNNATHFINPITFETLTGHKCLVDTFDRNFQFSVEHVALEKGRCASDRSRDRERHRKARRRHRGRHADDDGPRVHLSEDHFAGHEHADVRKSRRSGQPEQTRPQRL